MDLNFADPDFAAEARALHPAAHCSCGRFARWLGESHYYNGQFDCYSFDVACSRCGVVTVECV